MNDRSPRATVFGADAECPVAPPAQTDERFERLQAALARIVSRAVFPAPRQIRDWRGERCYGCFVQIDGSTYALHVGRGAYVTLHVERDLNGVRPREATRLVLQRSGIVREPNLYGSYSAY